MHTHIWTNLDRFAICLISTLHLLTTFFNEITLYEKTRLYYLKCCSEMYTNFRYQKGYSPGRIIYKQWRRTVFKTRKFRSGSTTSNVVNILINEQFYRTFNWTVNKLLKMIWKIENNEMIKSPRQKKFYWSPYLISMLNCNKRNDYRESFSLGVVPWLVNEFSLKVSVKKKSGKNFLVIRKMVDQFSITTRKAVKEDMADVLLMIQVRKKFILSEFCFVSMSLYES